MGKVSETLPPFLAKLLLLTQTTDKKISHWSIDGSVYVVEDDVRFNSILKKFFKGTKQTFIRQLHFYSFKKVEVSQMEKGMWGFQHEKGLFVRDNTELIKDIRRKTKVDPDSQKLASYYEVQALKAQISFLQQIVEDLRTQVSLLKSRRRNGDFSRTKSHIPKIGEEESVIVPFTKGNSFDLVKDSRKRQRTGQEPKKDSDFDEFCSSVTLPKGLKRVPSLGAISRLPSFNEGFEADMELESFSDLFSDLEIDSVASEAEDQESKLDQAVEAISEATQVKKSDVSKIITFLSQLSVKDQQNLVKKDKFDFAGCQNLDSITPLPVQKIGVGAS